MSEITKKGNMKNTIKCLGARSKQLAAAVLIGVGSAVLAPVASNAQVIVDFTGLTPSGGIFNNGGTIFDVTVSNFSSSTTTGASISSQESGSLLRMEQNAPTAGDTLSFSITFGSEQIFSVIANPTVLASNITTADTLIFTALDEVGAPIEDSIPGFAWGIEDDTLIDASLVGDTATIDGTKVATESPFGSFTLSPSEPIWGVRINLRSNTTIATSFNSARIQLDVVPEPSTVGLAIAAGVGLFMVRGRRRMLSKNSVL